MTRFVIIFAIGHRRSASSADGRSFDGVCSATIAAFISGNVIFPYTLDAGGGGYIL